MRYGIPRPSCGQPHPCPYSTSWIADLEIQSPTANETLSPLPAKSTVKVIGRAWVQ